VSGALLYGDSSGASWLLELMRVRQDISPIRDTLAFGPEFATAPAENEEPAELKVA
jgi:nitrite reductase (NADH) large subunit